MTAKEYLNQIRDLDLEIQRYKIDLEKLDNEYNYIPNPKFDIARSSSNSNGSVVERCLLKKESNEYECQIIYSKIDECNRKKDIIHNTIADMTDSTLKHLLFLRYEEYMRWEDIAEKMNYSERQILRLYKEALNLLEIIIKS